MTAPFSPLTLAELYALKVPELEYAVDDLLPMGAAVLFSAREKSGKGLFTIDLCACIALEEPFLERAVRGGVALYCAAEESIRTVRDRVKARIGDRTDVPFHVLRLNGETEDRLELERPETVQQLDDLITALRPAIVVLDPLREIHGGREDTSDDMAYLLKPVRQLAHKHNTLIVVNHHMNKLGGSRGSTAIPASFDQTLDFTCDDGLATDDTLAGALRIRGRDVKRQTIKITMGDHFRWRINQVSATFPEEGTRDRIVRALEDHAGGLTADELVSALGVARKTVQNLLSELRREKPPRITVEEGSGHKGSPYRYRAVQSRIIPPDDSPLRNDDGGNNRETSPDSSGTNGTNRRDESGSGRFRRCGCGEHVPWGEYCPRCDRDKMRPAA